MSHDKEHKHELHFTIDGARHEWHHQYITGAEIRKLGNIAPDHKVFMIVESPWEDEHIREDQRVDLALPGKKEFVGKEKHPGRIILTIETPNGIWHNAAFDKLLAVDQLIQKVIKKYNFAPDGNYKLKITGESDYLEGSKTLEGCGLKDHMVLIFTDIGKGA
jgi:hypothetical protein